MSSSRSTVHPAVFLALYLPSGLAFGYVVVTLGYLLPLRGLTVSQVAGIVALYFLPQTWKVIWAPFIDTTLGPRRWYAIGLIGSSVLLMGLAFVLLPGQPVSLQLLDALALLLSVISSIVMMATESLMAQIAAPGGKGRVAGWCQAGGLGGQGLGGGAGLWLAQHGAPWVAGSVLAAVCLLCGTSLWLLPVIQHHVAPAPAKARLLRAGKDVYALIRSRAGFLAALLVFMPIGTAAASNLWSAVASDWRASADVVALMNGVLGGAIMMAGCLVGGYLCDLINRKWAYILAGLALATCATAMAIAPRTPLTFEIFVSLYSFVSGCVYAAFTALALEAIGKDAAVTKYNLLACLSNIPITYMTLVDGSASTHYGPAAMLYVEAAVTLLAALLFGLIAGSTRRIRLNTPLGARDEVVR